MNKLHFFRSQRIRAFASVIPLLVFMTSCAQTPHPVGPARDYADAVDLFQRGNFNKAIDFSEGLAKSSPPTSYTDRARVLRVVIFSGQVKAFKELGEAYSKGWERTKNPQVKSDDAVPRHDSFQYGVEAAMYLDQTATQLTQGGSLPKDLTLEAPYPDAEGPTVIAVLNRVMDGAATNAGDREAAAIEAQRKGIDDALAEIVGGDRSEARNALKAGPVKLDSYEFSIFLTKQLLNGATIVDKKHMFDPARLRTLCAEADEVAKVALVTLKDNPDKGKEKEVKKLQGEMKAQLKSLM